MHATTLHRTLLTAALVLAAGVAAAQSTTAPHPTRDARADATTRVQVAPDVTLLTRVADPAMLRASRAFDALDRNGDGAVDRTEAAAEPGLGDSFSSVDSSGNDRLDRDEYTARLRR